MSRYYSVNLTTLPGNSSREQLAQLGVLITKDIGDDVRKPLSVTFPAGWSYTDNAVSVATEVTFYDEQERPRLYYHYKVRGDQIEAYAYMTVYTEEQIASRMKAEADADTLEQERAAKDATLCKRWSPEHKYIVFICTLDLEVEYYLGCQPWQLPSDADRLYVDQDTARTAGLNMATPPPDRESRLSQLLHELRQRDSCDDRLVNEWEDLYMYECRGYGSHGNQRSLREVMQCDSHQLVCFWPNDDKVEIMNMIDDVIGADYLRRHGGRYVVVRCLPEGPGGLRDIERTRLCPEYTGPVLSSRSGPRPTSKIYSLRKDYETGKLFITGDGQEQPLKANYTASVLRQDQGSEAYPA